MFENESSDSLIINLLRDRILVKLVICFSQNAHISINKSKYLCCTLCTDKYERNENKPYTIGIGSVL